MAAVVSPELSPWTAPYLHALLYACPVTHPSRRGCETFLRIVTQGIVTRVGGYRRYRSVSPGEIEQLTCRVTMRIPDHAGHAAIAKHFSDASLPTPQDCGSYSSVQYIDPHCSYEVRVMHGNQ